MTYTIYELVDTSDTILEQLGTKEKFWFYGSDKQEMLFKIGRPGTGENWAEKITSEIAKILDLPCAEYSFAVYGKKEGVITPSIKPEGGRLVLGNEVLAEIIKNYPKAQLYKVREYSLNRVLACIRGIKYMPIGYVGE